MPFIEIEKDGQKILLVLHHIISVEANDDGTCDITMSNGDMHYYVEDYNVVKSTIRESKCQ